MSHTSKQPSPNQTPLFHIKLVLPGGSYSLSTFIDWVAARIMDEGPIRQLGIGQIPLFCLIAVNALDSHLLGTVTHQTVPVHMLLSSNYPKTI